jgi:hypothetical protein
VAGGSNGGINGVNAIEGGAWLRGGLRRGSYGGVVKARATSEVELGGAGSGGRWWQRG